MDINPLVTVYIPTHDRPNLLIRAIKSVINQTYDNIEIIVSDDGSVEDIEQVVKSNIECQNINFIRSEVSKGACHARNLAINIAKGEYITGLDDDDEFEKNRIEELVKIYKNSKYSFLSTGIIFRTKNKEINAYNKCGVITLEKNLNSNEIGSQIFTKTENLKLIGGFDESLNAFQDYDCWIRLLKAKGEGFNIGGYTYIAHMEHDANRISTSDKRLIAIEKFVKKHSDILSSTNKRNQYSAFYINANRKLYLNEIIQVLTIKNSIAIMKTYIKNFFKNKRK